MAIEKCCNCGKSVAQGSNGFKGRAEDKRTANERQKAGENFPRGDFKCAECCPAPARTRKEFSVPYIRTEYGTAFVVAESLEAVQAGEVIEILEENTDNTEYEWKWRRAEPYE